MPCMCVKCNKSHGPGKCVIPVSVTKARNAAKVGTATDDVATSPSYTYKCVICDVESHSSNSCDCPKRKSLLEKRSKIVALEIPVAEMTTVRRRGGIRPNVSYASAARTGATYMRPASDRRPGK